MELNKQLQIQRMKEDGLSGNVTIIKDGHPWLENNDLILEDYRK